MNALRPILSHYNAPAPSLAPPHPNTSLPREAPHEMVSCIEPALLVIQCLELLQSSMKSFAHQLVHLSGGVPLCASPTSFGVVSELLHLLCIQWLL